MEGGNKEAFLPSAKDGSKKFSRIKTPKY